MSIRQHPARSLSRLLRAGGEHLERLAAAASPSSASQCSRAHHNTQPEEHHALLSNHHAISQHHERGHITSPQDGETGPIPATEVAALSSSSRATTTATTPSTPTTVPSPSSQGIIAAHPKWHNSDLTSVPSTAKPFPFGAILAPQGAGPCRRRVPIQGPAFGGLRGANHGPVNLWGPSCLPLSYSSTTTTSSASHFALVCSPRQQSLLGGANRCSFFSSLVLSQPESATSASPVSSPLLGGLPLPRGGDGGEGDEEGGRVVRAAMSRIKQSVKKVNLVATLVRGMPVEDAMMQLALLPKRAAKVVAKVVHAARSNAIQNHGLEEPKLIIAEAYVNKDRYLKRLSFHGRGKTGVMHRPRCRVTVAVREMTLEEIEKRQRLMASRWRRRKVSKLAPHQVIHVGKPKSDAQSVVA